MRTSEARTFAPARRPRGHALLPLLALVLGGCASASASVEPTVPVAASAKPAEAQSPRHPVEVATPVPPAPQVVEEPLPPAKAAWMALSQGIDSPVDRALAAGDQALDAGNLVAALRAYDSARGLAPRAAAPLVGVARVRVTMTDVAMDYAAGKGNADILAARGMLKRAVTIDPAYAPAQVELGRVLLLLGDASGAMDSLHRAVTLAPDDAEAHSVLGVASLATGHADEAVGELRAAARLDRGSAARHGNLATALLMGGKVSDAVKEYELQVRIDGQDARAHSDLGTALLASSVDADPPRALTELRRAIALDPSRATFHSNLGYALQLQGSMPEAIVEYRQALSLDPHLASAWINLATALAKDPKTRTAARSALSEARKIDPADPRVKANLDELDSLEREAKTP